MIAAVAVAAITAWYWSIDPRSPGPATALLGVSPTPGLATSSSNSPAAAPEPGASPLKPVSPLKAWRADELGAAQDLRRIFDAYIGSADPRLHQTAVRAFSACAPAFLPRPGETPSPDALIAALPQELHAEREVAYRAIYARCAPLLGMGRDHFQALQRAIQANDGSREAGARAQNDLAAGNDDIASQRIGQALASGDPVSVASLAGVAEAWARRSSAAPADPLRLAAARALDAALTWVACDLGMACGSDSLSALQACATQGQCAGDLPARLTGAALSEPAERTAVQAQRKRLLDLLKDGRTLAMADLLP